MAVVADAVVVVIVGRCWWLGRKKTLVKFKIKQGNII
jgi:hypothetical protein